MAVVWFLLGLGLGSFALVLVSRYEKEGLKGALLGRSRCDYCGKTLSLKELLPVISFIVQKGRCLHCRKKLKVSYPLWELGFAVLAVLLAFGSQSMPHAFFTAILVTFLICLAVLDANSQEVPEQLVLIALVFALSAAFAGGLGFMDIFWGAVLGGAVPAVLVFLSGERWMGVGDIEVGVVIGVWLGAPLMLTAWLLAFVSGAVWGLSLIYLGRAGVKTSVAFIPFIAAGGVLSFFYGQSLLNWILGG